ncbi:MAG: hypothetical protein ACOYOU_16355 [Kiritimatiellia bacterium]
MSEDLDVRGVRGGLVPAELLKKCTVYIHEAKPGEASFRVVIRGKDAELITARMMETALRADELNIAARVDAMEKEMRDMRGAISRIKEVL